MLTFKIVFVTTILLKLFRISESYITTVDARAKDCYYERGPKMSKLMKYQFKTQNVTSTSSNFDSDLIISLI